MCNGGILGDNFVRESMNIRLLILSFFIFFLPVSSTLLSLSLTLSQRQLCDIELILNGGFSPLDGFMNRADYDSVVNDMHLAQGALWPIPIVLDVTESVVKKLAIDNKLELRSADGTIIATMNAEDIWQPDKKVEAQSVYGTLDMKHPGVAYLFNQTNPYYVGGKLTLVNMPEHYDFKHLRHTPAELKALFKEKNISKIVAFQTRNPMHYAHQKLTENAAKQLGAHLLLQPVVGLTKPGDVDYFTRVRCYEKLLPSYEEGSVTLSLLPLSMRMAGPREALWHAIIRKNYGCTTFIVGRDHAGPGNDSNGKPFYDPYAAQELVLNYAQASHDLILKYAPELGIDIIKSQEVVYVPSTQSYKQVDKVPQGIETWSISGTQLRAMLRDGLPIPTWFSPQGVIDELQKTFPPKNKQGFVVFFTGLPSSGKSTLAEALAIKFHELQHRQITILDGDEVRIFLSSELNFSKEHRSLNIRRIGWVANLVSKSGGIVVCCPIAPYEEDRQLNRKLIADNTSYIEVYVSTSLAECERRDVKGLYAKARAGLIPNFTGVTDPYEVPKNPDIVIDTEHISISDGVDVILNHLNAKGLIA